MDKINKKKNVKISLKHHEMLKEHCEKNGLKVYRVLEKMIDELCKSNKITDDFYKSNKKKDLYGD